jgi:glutathione S-transferase
VLDLLRTFYDTLGLQNYRLLLNSIGDSVCRPGYIEKLRAYYADKLDRMCGDCKRRYELNPLRMLDCKNEPCQPFKAGAPKIADNLCDECAAHFAAVRGYLDELGIAYEIDPIIPFMGDERFSRISPLRRIPVLIDEQVTLADSWVICQYLEDRQPDPALYPRDIALRARARWLEEYADTRMGDVFIWKLFNQVAINPFVWGEKTDEKILAQTLEQDLPDVLDHLETQLPAEGFLFGEISIADISIACFFRNAAFAGYRVDSGRWPRTAAFVARMLGLECFARLAPFEDRMIRTPIPRHRAVLAELGAPLLVKSYATATPRRGVMRI